MNYQNQKLVNLMKTKDYLDVVIKDKHKEFQIDSEIRPNCPHCNSSIIKKNGKTKNGTQRYLCLSDKCSKSFSSNTNTFISGSKKLHKYLFKMIKYTVDRLTIREISDDLDVPITTVWTWRTKILSFLEELTDDVSPLTRLIYLDETYVKVSLKGTKPKDMQGKSYKTKKPVVAKRELLCIQTLIDDSKRPLFKINGTAKLTREKLDSFLLPFIKDEDVIVTDGEPAYIGFTDDHYITHERILNYKEKSDNGYSLGPINSIHSSFKFMLSKYKGISSKRLNGYINLFIVKYTFKQIFTNTELINHIYESMLDSNFKITNEQIKQAKFPIDIDKLYRDLKNEGLVE